MIVVKHPNKERVFVYENIIEYENSIYGMKSRHIACFYFRWAHGRILESIGKFRNNENEGLEVKAIERMNEYFRGSESRQFLPLEFNVTFDDFNSQEFKKVLELKIMLKLY